MIYLSFFVSQIALPVQMIQVVAPPHSNVMRVKETVIAILNVLVIYYVERTTVSILTLLGLILPLTAAQKVKTS